MGHMGMGSDDDSDLSDDDSPKKRRDLLTRRPSYRKILNDLGGGEIGNLIFMCSVIKTAKLFFRLRWVDAVTKSRRTGITWRWNNRSI